MNTGTAYSGNKWVVILLVLAFVHCCISLPSYIVQPELVLSDNATEGIYAFSAITYGVHMTQKSEITWHMDELSQNYQPLKDHGDSFFTNDSITSACGSYIRRNKNREVVATYTVSDEPGLAIDGHELLVNYENNHVFMITKVYKTGVNLKPYGGPRDATVVFNSIEEQDENGRKVWEWDWSSYFRIEDLLDNPTISKETLNTMPADIIHANALSFTPDGNLLLGVRKRSEIVKIEYPSGRIMWVIGGYGSSHNNFTFVNEKVSAKQGTSWQHNPHFISENRILIFDNGRFHDPPHARAVEFELDFEKMTATNVWEFPYVHELPTVAMGSVQRLSNGHTMISWGTNEKPFLTEVSADGDLRAAFNLPDGTDPGVYRVYFLEDS